MSRFPSTSLRLRTPGIVPQGAPIEIEIEGRLIPAIEGESVAAALTAAGVAVLRRARNGEARGVFCGMGVCFECLVTVDGRPGQRACMTGARDGMRVATHRDDGPAVAAVEMAPLVPRPADRMPGGGSGSRRHRGRPGRARGGGGGRPGGRARDGPRRAAASGRAVLQAARAEPSLRRVPGTGFGSSRPGPPSSSGSAPSGWRSRARPRCGAPTRAGAPGRATARVPRRRRWRSLWTGARAASARASSLLPPGRTSGRIRYPAGPFPAS